MPRYSVDPASKTEAPQVLVASVTRLPGRVSRNFRQSQTWQSEAWRHYDICGELRYAANWIGNVMSRAILVPGKRTNDGVDRVSAGVSVDALAALFGGPNGQSQMLASIGIHLTIAGECYVVGRNARADRGERSKVDIWEVVSTKEMHVTTNSRGDKWWIDYEDGLNKIELTDDEVILRVWRPHPRKHNEADSPVRAMLGTLRELELLSAHITSQVISRLTGNGILFMPSDMTFPPPPTQEGAPALNTAESFMVTLGEAMMAAKDDPSSASAQVPIVVTAQGDMLDKPRWMTFWSDLDEKVLEMRSAATQRLALGLDLPAEVLLGTADMNHWGAWQMEESSIKAHIEPLLELVANAFTVGWLVPVTEDPDDVVAYDTAALRLRPNRSKEAIELFDRGELSGDALRRETGFDTDDAPDPEEFKQWMLRKVASGSSTPEQVAQALGILGILGITGEGDNSREERPSPSLEDHPVRELPDQQAASLLDKSEVMVYRALERAGNRIRSLKQIRPGCSAADTYLFVQVEPGEMDKVLDDAWSCIPRLLKGTPGYQQTVIEHALDAYTRTLLLTQKEYDRATMERFLTSTPVRTLEDA